jgi:hypothetical protein
LSRLQILFPSHRFCARRIFLLMRQCPQTPVFRGFCDATIVLAYALNKMRRESRIKAARDRVLENVYEEHGASCGAPKGTCITSSALSRVFSGRPHVHS